MYLNSLIAKNTLERRQEWDQQFSGSNSEHSTPSTASDATNSVAIARKGREPGSKNRRNGSDAETASVSKKRRM